MTVPNLTLMEYQMIDQPNLHEEFGRRVCIASSAAVSQEDLMTRITAVEKELGVSGSRQFIDGVVSIWHECKRLANERTAGKS